MILPWCALPLPWWALLLPWRRCFFLGARCFFLGVRCFFLGGHCFFLGARFLFLGGHCFFLGGRCFFLGGRCFFLGGRCFFLGRCVVTVRSVAAIFSGAPNTDTSSSVALVSLGTTCSVHHCHCLLLEASFPSCPGWLPYRHFVTSDLRSLFSSHL